MRCPLCLTKASRLKCVPCIQRQLQRFSLLEQQKRTESDSIAVKLEELSAEKRPHASVSVEISLLRHRIAKLENKAAERRLAIERDRKRNELIREEIAFRKSLLSTAKEGRALAKDPARESQMRGALDNRDIESKKLQSAQRRLIQELIQLFRLKVVNELALSPVASGLSNLNFSQTRYTLVDSDPFNPCNGPSGMPLNDFNSNIGLLAQLVTLLSHYLHYTLPFLLDCTGAGFVIRFGIEEDSAPHSLFLDLEETNEEAFFYALSLLNLNVAHICAMLGVSVQFLQIPDTIGNLLQVVKILKCGPTGSEHPKEGDMEIDFDKLLRYQRFLFQVAPQDRSPELLEKALAPPLHTEDEWQIL